MRPGEKILLSEPIAKLRVSRVGTCPPQAERRRGRRRGGFAIGSSDSGNPPCGHEGGQAILESLLTMIVLLTVLLGLLQIFQLATAKLLINHSAFRSLRSYTVGFDDYLVKRSARVAVIGASGKLVSPDSADYSSPLAQFAAEEFMIPEYLSGNRWLEYEYWLGGNEYNPDYYHASVEPPNTYLRYSVSENESGLATQRVYFSNYPYAIFDMADRNRVWFPLGPSTEISSTSTLLNHAADYLGGE